MKSDMQRLEEAVSALGRGLRAGLDELKAALDADGDGTATSLDVEGVQLIEELSRDALDEVNDWQGQHGRTPYTTLGEIRRRVARKMRQLQAALHLDGRTGCPVDATDLERVLWAVAIAGAEEIR